MIWWLLLVVVVFLGGIILLSAKSPLKKVTREEFLEELTKFLEGTLEPIVGEKGESSFRIRFKFKGQDFVYEDLQKQGFKDKVYKAYLKTETPSKLTLTFTERKRSTKIRTDIFIASEISTHQVNEHIQLEIPKYLKDLKVFTNDPEGANKVFEDGKVMAVFKKFKNVGPRGYPFLSVGIVEGVVILEFPSTKTCHPNLFALQADIPSIDDYLEKLMVVVSRLKEDS